MRTPNPKFTVIILAVSLAFSGILVNAAPVSEPELLGYDYMMMVENTTAWTGECNHVFHIRGSWNDDIKEYSLKLFYDVAKIQIVTITLDGCVGIDAAVFDVVDNPLSGYVTALVQKPAGILVGEGTLFTFIINVSESLAAGSTPFTFDSGEAVTYFISTRDIKFLPQTINGHLDIKTGNRPPEPPVIHGPPAAGFGIALNYSAVSDDYEGDTISYKWDWGDGNVSDWIGPYNAGEPMTTNHSWGAEGAYVIKVKAKDVTGNVSDWSEYPVSIAQQISFNNLKAGYIYFRIFTFNKSFFYINLLDALGAAVIFSTSDLVVNATASNAVQAVRFEAMIPLIEEPLVRIDNDSSNGFSATLNLTRGLYQVTIFAYDADGNLIDGQIVPYVVFLRIGRSDNSSGLYQLFSKHLINY